MRRARWQLREIVAQPRKFLFLGQEFAAYAQPIALGNNLVIERGGRGIQEGVSFESNADLVGIHSWMLRTLGRKDMPDKRCETMRR